MSRHRPTPEEQAALQEPCGYCRVDPGEWCRNLRPPRRFIPTLHPRHGTGAA